MKTLFAECAGMCSGASKERNWGDCFVVDVVAVVVVVAARVRAPRWRRH